MTDVNEFSELVYGFKRHGPFNPSRDIIFPIAMQNDIVWDWLMLASAAHIASQGGNLPERFLNHRRSLVYGKLGRAINTPNQHVSDALILSITAAILVEARFGDPKSIIIHLQGMKACLDQRGGITSLVSKWWYPTVIQGLHIAGMGLPPSSVPGDWTIIPKIDNLSRILGLVQNVGIGYRHAARRESDSEHPSRWRIAVPAEYIAARKTAFSPAAPLHDILRASHLGFSSTSRVKQHCSLAVLLSLNIALWEYRTEPAAVKYYLETLVSRIRLNEAFKVVGPAAKIETLNWVLVMGKLDIQGREGKWADREFMRAWSVVDMMQVIAKLEEETRIKVETLLFRLLVHDEGGNQKESPETEGIDSAGPAGPLEPTTTAATGSTTLSTSKGGLGPTAADDILAISMGTGADAEEKDQDDDLLRDIRKELLTLRSALLR